MNRAWYVRITGTGYSRDVVGPFDTEDAAEPFVEKVLATGDDLLNAWDGCDAMWTDAPVGFAHQPGEHNDRFGWTPAMAGSVPLATAVDR